MKLSTVDSVAYLAAYICMSSEKRTGCCFEHFPKKIYFLTDYIYFGIYSDVGKDTQICLSSEFPYQYIRGIVIQLKMSFYRDFPYYQKTHFQTPCWTTTVQQQTLYKSGFSIFLSEE